MHIIHNELRDVPSGVLTQLPERENMKKIMRRECCRNLALNPKTVEDLEEIPGHYQKTLMGNRFLIFDSQVHPNSEVERGRVLVFATHRNLVILAKSDILFLDGTFKVAAQYLPNYLWLWE